MDRNFIDFFKIQKNIGRILSNKYLAMFLILLILVTLNTLIVLKFPGISNADVRPQIVLICLAGFYYGPVYGFLVGFIGNMFSDLLLGNGSEYLLSWSIGNGLMGMIMGFNRMRGVLKLYKISQLLELTLFLIFSNVAFVTYSSIIYNLNHGSLTFDTNLKYFFLPILNSNILASLLLFPVFLLLLGRLKINFPIKIALSNFYMIAFFLQVAWFVNKTNFDVSGFIFNSNLGIDEGNQIVQAFNVWSMMLIIFLLTSFFISIFISEKITRPIVELDRNVHKLLQSDIQSPDSFDKLTRRDDEIGLLSYTIGLLSEKLWDSQVHFINDFTKRMTFISAEDTITDIYEVGLVSIFGKKFDFSNYEVRGATGHADISHIEAIEMLIKLADLEELAYTYNASKMNSLFHDMINDEVILSDVQLQHLAVAVDLGLVFKGKIRFLDLHSSLTKDFAYHLLFKTTLFVNNKKKFIGYVTEPDIISRLEEKWNNTAMIPNPDIEYVMNDLIRKKIISGYHIKMSEEVANFDHHLKITYTHDNFKHVKQLVGLIISENIQAKINIEKKHSTFIYYNEWDITENLSVEPINDKIFLASRFESDIVFEFTSPDKKDHFRAVTNDFAKKDYNRKKNIIFQSWYEPLITSDVPLNSYNRINEITIQHGGYMILTFVAEETLTKALNKLSEFYEKSVIRSRSVWVNDDFFLYLKRD
ncbi:MAG: ECF transporter S component [Bacteroidota bacterium]